MPRIKLAHHTGDHGPGDELDVTADELHALARDGRVAEVLGSVDGGIPLAAPTEVVDDGGSPEQAETPADPGRAKKR